MEKVLHQNSYGVTMIREDYKRRSLVKVVAMVEGKRHHIRTYRFNHIEQEIAVPYCSWANLDCCGGWNCDEEYLDTAVQKGLKLFAGREAPLKGPYTPNYPTMEEAAMEFRKLKDTLPDGVFADIETVFEDSNYFRTFICRTGRIADYIDLNEVFELYESLGHPLPEDTKKEIRSLCDIEMKQYGTVQAPFEYARATTATQLAVTGLLLGYPIESTVSILEGW